MNMHLLIVRHRMFAIDAIASGTGHLDLVKSSEIFDLSLASEGSSSSATTSYAHPTFIYLSTDYFRRSSSSSASPSSGTSQKPSAYESVVLVRVSLYSDICPQYCNPTL